MFKDIPESVRKAHMNVCANCPERKYFARFHDMHFDWLDCWYDCPNDVEHYERERKNNEYDGR